VRHRAGAGDLLALALDPGFSRTVKKSALVPIEQREVGGELIQTVDARELHSFLEVGKAFGAWVTERIEQYGFQFGRDFEVFSESGNNPQGGRPTKHYHLSLDMAKELSMVERNARGKQARQYFIDCERQVKEAAKPKALPLDDPSFLRQALHPDVLGSRIRAGTSI
jgi:anti-repressor protein